jgi:hypothetical protein
MGIHIEFVHGHSCSKPMLSIEDLAKLQKRLQHKCQVKQICEAGPHPYEYATQKHNPNAEVQKGTTPQQLQCQGKSQTRVTSTKLPKKEAQKGKLHQSLVRINIWVWAMLL